MAEDTPNIEAPERKGVDWDAVDPHWRAGIVSVGQLEREFGVSRAAIRKHFKKLGIERSLTATIRAEANAMVERAEVHGGQLVPPAKVPPAGSDQETVGVNARIQAEVILRHRKDVQRAQRVAGALLTELESQTFDAPLYAKLDELVRRAGGSGKLAGKTLVELQAIYARTTSTGARTENMRKLADIFKVLSELERKVHGIDDSTPVDPEARVQEAVASGLAELKARFAQRLAAVPPAKPTVH